MFEQAEEVEFEESEFRGPLESLEAAKEYILGGNARFTIKSRKSGKCFTYRVAKKRGADAADPYFISVLRGSNNDVDFVFFGTLFPEVLDGGIEPGQPVKVVSPRLPQFAYSRKSYLKSNAPSVLAFSWFWRQIEKGELPEEVEVWHEGRCGICGRTLTVPESIARGIGPECAMKIHAMGLLESLL